MTRRATALVFVTLVCLYALTGGGQGYSVDGTFSYELATSVATDPSLTFARRNAETLRRWGPLLPAVGVPFAWAGARLAELAPPRSSVVIAGERLMLRDWPPISADDFGGGRRLELRVPAASDIGALRSLRLVSYLSLSTSIEDGATVAEVLLVSASGTELGRAQIHAGKETAEWAIDVRGADRARHGRAAVAGRWPGNPEANLYWADVPLSAPTAPALVYITYTGGRDPGRLHVRAVQLRGERGSVELPGPVMSSGADDVAFFTRFGFSFVNGPVVALACALLVPLGCALGYGLRTSAAVGLGAGMATPLWPYAKHDFAEPVAALFIVAATLLVVASRGRPWCLMAVGLCAALAAGARYTAVWVLPILAVQVGLAAWQNEAGPTTRRVGGALRSVAALLALPAMALIGVVVATGRVPTMWSGTALTLVRGWLDFPLWNGIYGLLLSPGKGLGWYAPVVVLAALGVVSFVRRHRAAALVFVALPVAYALTYGSKGVWHGGGWGPRYLVPVLPLLACLALPVAVSRPRFVTMLAGLSVAVQLLGVLKHPNLYTVMFRDHIAPSLSEYGRGLGGVAAEGYWRHFGGPDAARQLSRPPSGIDPSKPQRGLGYAYAERGPLHLTLDPREPFTLTLYACDWDRRARRQRVTIGGARASATIDLNHDFSDCEYHATQIDGAGEIRIAVQETAGRDVPVLSALFFDRAAPSPPAAGNGDWVGRVGRDGYVLFAWDRGADVVGPSQLVSGYAGGERVWVDTWQTELSETALLYAPGFSPLLAHGWLLAADAVSTFAPTNAPLVQRALASPPWRYVHGLEIHAAHPEYGLGLDLWPVLLRSQFRSHAGVMAAVWLVTSLLAAGVILGVLGCVGVVGREERTSGRAGRPRSRL